MRRIVCFQVIVFLVLLASIDACGGENLWYSVFVPGWGQVRSGHYGRGSLFLGTELVSLTALVISDIQYNRAVEQYESARASYLNAAYVGDAMDDYVSMHAHWNSAESLDRYRQTALYAAIGVWAVNIVDMILFDEREEPPLALEARPGGFSITGSISF